MKFIKKRDFIIIAVILLAACIFYFVYNMQSDKGTAKAEIYYESELVMTVMLNENEDRVFKLPQNENVVFHLYEDGSIRFEESDCPDEVCIKSGKLRHIGSSAACLPNKVILKIVPVKDTDDNDIDIIVRK